MRSTLLLVSLLVPQLAGANPNEDAFMGEYDLAGKEGRRAVRVTLKVKTAPGGKVVVERARRHRSGDAATWTSEEVSFPRARLMKVVEID